MAMMYIETNRGKISIFEILVIKHNQRRHQGQKLSCLQTFPLSHCLDMERPAKLNWKREF